ncbi:MAG: type ISP restriction/modification enzyme, partial [Terriglobia bacterium]
YRSFDRQWIIPDNRLLLSARPNLWDAQTASQLYLISLERRAPESGPSITFSALLPDMNFYKGSSGGRVFPIWLDAVASQPNIKPALLAHLANVYAEPVKAEDVMAYLAAVMAHPAPEPLPDTMDYDPATRRLKIGKGYVENVTPEMWAYEVSGKEVLWHWFSYRRRDRSRPIIGERRPPSPLDSIQPDHWLPEYTSDLLDLLNVLGRLIALEPKQADLLNRICAGQLRHADELRDAGALTHSEEKPTKQKGKSKSKV